MEINITDILSTDDKRMYDLRFSNGEDENIHVLLTESQLDDLSLAINKIRYKDDILDRFCGEDSEYDETLSQDNDLIERMVEFYSQSRFQHNTGGCMEDVAHWSISIRETEDEFAAELAKYLKR